MHYPMKLVVQKTGIRSETLRAWERRYSGIRPDRDSKGRRVYSGVLLEKLVLLSILVDQGLRIGDIANRRIEDLRLQVDQLSSARPQDICPEPSAEAACDSALTFEDTRLWLELERASIAYGPLEMVDGFVFPLVRELERKQSYGNATAVHVRFAVCCIRTFLSNIAGPTPGQSELPKVIIASPLGQTSDIGSVASAIFAQAAGWHPISLGTSVPGEQIIEAVRSAPADAVVIAANSEHYNTSILSELLKVRKNLGADFPIYFGGRMPEALRTDIEHGGLRSIRRMRNLRENLESLRTAAAHPSADSPAATRT